MNFFIKHIIGIVTVTTIFIGCLLLFLFALASKSIQQQQIEVSHQGILISPASIQEDKYGIPYLYASNDEDAMFLMGVTHAKDRLFQMDFLRRAGRGQLSEVLGANYIQSDKFARTLQLHVVANSLASNCSDSIRRLVDAYSRGVNYFINNNKNSLSIEFDNLGYIPQEWTIEDSYLLWKLHCLESDVSFWASLTSAELQYSLGEENAKELLPFTIKELSTLRDTTSKKGNAISLLITITKDANTFLPYIPPFSIQVKSETKTTSPKSTTRERSQNHSFEEFSNQSKQFRTILGWNQSKSACATWVYTTKGDTAQSNIFVADIHSTLQLPAKWYICTIVTGNSVVSGATMPGIPFVINGRNSSLSWAFTSYSVDQTDLFVEVLNDNATLCTKNNSESVPVVYAVDTVIQKDNEPLFFRRRSVNGLPILSDWFPKDSSWIQKSIKPKKSIYSEYILSVKSLLFDTTVDPFTILNAISISINTQESKKAISLWKYPAQLFHSTDIGFQSVITPIGAVPIRNAECVYTFTNPGWNDQRFGWTGLYDLLQQQDVKVDAKKTNYSIATNTELQFQNGKQYSGWYDPYFRFKRINTLLSNFQDYSIREAQFMLNDVTSLYALEIVGEVKKMYPKLEKELSEQDRQLIEPLLKWEGIYSLNDSISLLYSIFTETLKKEIFLDDLGEYYFTEYIALPSVQTNKTLLILRDTLDSKWTGNLAQQSYQTKKNLLISVIKKTNQQWKNFLQNKAKNATYVYFSHLTDAIPSIRKLSALGPFEYKGDEFTIQTFERSLISSKSKGSSFRFITNLLENYYYCVLPGGNSGEPLDVHYSDQMQLWLNGGYCKVFVTNQPLQNLTSTYTFN